MVRQSRDPLVRSPMGFDYLDNLLDIEIAPDLSEWNWKDEDELEDVVARGMMTARKADGIRAEGRRVIEALNAKAPPFDEPWHLWRPETGWETPGLPDGWNDLSENPPAAAMSASRSRGSPEVSPDMTGDLMFPLKADDHIVFRSRRGLPLQDCDVRRPFPQSLPDLRRGTTCIWK